MAFDKTPTTHIPNWSEDGTNITVPLASFPQLTAAEADAANGDIRKIAFALADKLERIFAAMAVADRPANMAITRNTTTNDVTGVVQRSYNFVFNLATVAEEVADEA